jgi:hypothetical protein
MAEPFLPGLINDMFGSGLSEELIHCLHSISAPMPSQQAEIEDRTLQADLYAFRQALHLPTKSVIRSHSLGRVSLVRNLYLGKQLGKVTPIEEMGGLFTSILGNMALIESQPYPEPK